jgi:hypothetical protein
LSISSIMKRGLREPASRSARTIVPGIAPTYVRRWPRISADADAFEGPAERPRDRPAERGLADARRADEAQDRAARVGLELAHREELEDAVLDLLDVVVILVQDLPGMVEIEVVLGGLVPGQRRDPLQVAADDAVLGGRGGQALEPLQLAVGLAPDLLGEVDRVELLAQLIRLGHHLVGLAELLLDRLELLAQEVLALRAVELGLDLGLDLRPDRDHVQLARQDLRQPPQALAHVHLFEQRLLLLDLQPQRAGNQVREGRGVVDVGHRELELLRQVRHLLDDGRERLLDVAHERRELDRLHDDVRGLLDRRDEVGLLGGPARDAHPLGALDEHAQRAVRHPDHARDHARDADVEELVRAGRLQLGILRGHHHEHAVARQHVVDELYRALLTDGEGRERVREGDRLAQRKHGQGAGQLAHRGEIDRPVGAGQMVDVELGHVGHYSSGLLGTSIGTLRGRSSLSAIGSSTCRKPSS